MRNAPMTSSWFRGAPPIARKRSLRMSDADTVIAWLGAADMTALDALASDTAFVAGISQLFLSSTLLGDEVHRVPAPLVGRTVIAHPFVAPDRFEQHAARSLAWMTVNHLTPSDRQVATNALFAIVLAGDALNLPRTIASREYFIERIEHMAGKSLQPTAYPSVTFGATRRPASAGCYLFKLPASPGEPFTEVQQWYVPRS